MWLNKANAFSLFILLANTLRESEEIGVREIKNRLAILEGDIPPSYAISSKEGVNNRKERELRDKWLRSFLFGETAPDIR
jgi:hypothetical protein